MGCTDRELRDARWRTSSYSGANGDCVEVAGLPGGRWAVRDTKDRSRPALTFSPVSWTAFVDGVRDGVFDRTS